MKIYSFKSSSLSIPLISPGLSCGFPSPADDHLDEGIDLNREYIRNKDATFFGRVIGDSMIGAGLEEGDLLIIDKSLEPRNGKIAVCFIDGEFTVKRIKISEKTIWLTAENERYKPIQVTQDNDFLIWGIVTTVIKDL